MARRLTRRLLTAEGGAVTFARAGDETGEGVEPHHAARRRVLLLTEYFHPHWTGLSKSFLSLARALAADGDEITVLTTRFTDSVAPVERFGDIEVRRVPYAFRFSRTHYAWRMLPAAWRALSRHDVVIINSPFSNVLPCAIMARLHRCRLVIFHQGDLVLPRHGRFPWASALLERCFDVVTIPALALAHTVSTYTTDYARHSRVMRRFTAKCKPYVPRPLFEPVRPDARESDTRSAPRIGFAGRFVDEKGFDVLLDAIPRVIERVPRARFVFAGATDIPYEDTYDRLRDRVERVAGHVEFLGLLRDDALRAFYRGLDVFVLSSRTECFALTQAEAALLGVPVVASDVPGARMLVRETGFGELVRPGDPAELAEGILAVLRHRDRYVSKYDQVERFFQRHGQPVFD